MDSDGLHAKARNTFYALDHKCEQQGCREMIPGGLHLRFCASCRLMQPIPTTQRR